MMDYPNQQPDSGHLIAAFSSCLSTGIKPGLCLQNEEPNFVFAKFYPPTTFLNSF